jgi:hypothetical protein
MSDSAPVLITIMFSVLAYRRAPGDGGTIPEDEALLEVDRLQLRLRINCASQGTRRIKFDELAEYYLKVEINPEVTASPKSENTVPILAHYVRDIIIARWGDQIAEDIEPLEIQKWFNRLHNKDEYARTTVSKIRGIMNRIYKVGIIQRELRRIQWRVWRPARSQTIGQSR